MVYGNNINIEKEEQNNWNRPKFGKKMECQLCNKEIWLSEATRQRGILVGPECVDKSNPRDGEE